MNALEDIGVFSGIDNVSRGCCPALRRFPRRATTSWSGWRFPWTRLPQQEQIETALQQLDEQKTPYKILASDAPTMC